MAEIALDEKELFSALSRLQAKGIVSIAFVKNRPHLEIDNNEQIEEIDLVLADGVIEKAIEKGYIKIRTTNRGNRFVLHHN